MAPTAGSPATCRTATRARSRRGIRARWTGSRRASTRLGLHAALRRTSCRTTGTGRGQNVLFDNFFATRAGAVVPEPPVLDRGDLGRRARQPAARAEPDPRLRTRSAATRRRCRRSTSTTARGGSRKVPPCFDFLTEGDLLQPRPDPVGVLRGERGPEGLHLVGVLGDPPLPDARGPVAASTCSRSTRSSSDIRRRPAAAGHVDHAAVRAVRAPRVQLLPRRELVHEA